MSAFLGLGETRKTHIVCIATSHSGTDYSQSSVDDIALLGEATTAEQ
jgi:hypothetical protein